MAKTFIQWWLEVGEGHPSYRWESENRKKEVKRLAFEAWCASMNATGYLPSYEEQQGE